MEIIYKALSELIPYANNAKQHPPVQVANLAESIRRFGFRNPVLIDGGGVIVAGHGRCLAAAEAGLSEVPCVICDDMSEADIRAYRVLDNKLTESPWDYEKLSLELPGLDLSGFELPALDEHFWGETETEESDEYKEFVDKFIPKLTTDDCYTPANIYAAVRNWAVGEYGLEGATVLRPFYPGGDYEHADYPADSVVIDNPPFSILSEICRFYQSRKIRFFLFAPGVTLYSISSGRVNYLPVGNTILFENGAQICIGFVTNMGEFKIDTAPELYSAIETANIENLQKAHAQTPIYDYPKHVVTVQMNKLAKYGQRLKISAPDCCFIRALDAQREQDKAIYGGGFLLSEKAAAEKAAANIWLLSEREQELIRKMAVPE